MTFRDRFKGHVVALRALDEASLSATFDALHEELGGFAAKAETVGAAAVSEPAVDAMAKAAALFYVAGERTEKATGEDAAP